MRVIRKILVGLGAVFVVILAFVAWMMVSSRQFRTEQGPFVQTFVTDLSRHWNVADVGERLAGPVLDQALTPQGQQVLHQFKQLGALRSVANLGMQNYNIGTTGRTGTFHFKGTFDNGEADVEVVVVKRGGTPWVLGFHLNGIQRREGVSNVET